MESSQLRQARIQHFMTGLKYLLFTATDHAIKDIEKPLSNTKIETSTLEAPEMSWSISDIWTRSTISTMETPS